MFPIKNDIKNSNNFIQGNTTAIRFDRGKHIKRISMYLYCISYNEINMRHAAIQNHVSYKIL